MFFRINSFNPDTVAGLMCTTMINVDWRGCPNHETARESLREVLCESNIKVMVHNMSIDSHDEALAKSFLGSPRIRINGVDIEPGLENHASERFLPSVCC